VDLWRIVPGRPLEPEITLLEFFFCEIGKVGRSVNRCALFRLLQQFHSLHVLPEGSVPMFVLGPVVVGLVVSLHKTVERSEAVKMHSSLFSRLFHLK